MGSSHFYEKPCPCGKGKVKWEAYEKYSSWGGTEQIPREILCEHCKVTHEIKTHSGYDKYGESYHYTSIDEKSNHD